MIVSFGHNNISCNDLNEFEALVNQQLSMDSAEIWISENGDTEECPCLAILVNENGAYVNYFGEDGSCHASYGKDGDDAIIPFCDGQYEVRSSQIISKSDALRAILAFFRNKGRSDLIQWQQLY